MVVSPANRVKKCDVSGLSVMVKDQLPDVSFISAENLVHNTGIVGGVGGQFNAELLSGIFMGGGAENETAGGIFPNQTGFYWCCTVLLRCRLCMFTSCREERIA